MNHERAISRQRRRRRNRVRNKLRGTTERPRLSVVRSHKHLCCQVIDDTQGATLVSYSTKDKDWTGGYGGNCDAATQLGKAVAERALSAGIQSVRLDRGSYKYHGRVAALAAAVREAGLKI